MRLDATGLRYLGKDEFRTLVAIELGMKNHEVVPTPLICSLSKLKRGATHKALVELHKYKLIYHDATKYDGYKLTYLGYDYLALKAFAMRGSVTCVGPKIGVGKESDIHKVANDSGELLVLKLHRLGRVSFRAIKEKRDYLKHRKSASWLYLSRLAALKEFAYMKALYENGFPVPKPYDVNRHCIVMQCIDGIPLCNVSNIEHPQRVYSALMNLIIKLASYGLIHGDFNEFNLMIDTKDEANITLIDFPQMVSTSHYNAEYYFDRDVQCVRTFFQRKFGFESSEYPRFKDYNKNENKLDVEIQASGFTKSHQTQLEQYDLHDTKEEGFSDEESDEVESDDESDDEGGYKPKKEQWHSIGFERKNLNRDEHSDQEDNDDSDDDIISVGEKESARAKVLAQIELDRREAGITKVETSDILSDTKESVNIETKEDSGGDEEAEDGDGEKRDVEIREKVKRSLNKKNSKNVRGQWKQNSVKKNKKKSSQMLLSGW